MATSSISRPGAVENISSLYTLTKSSGNLSVNSLTAYRSGKMVFISLSGTLSAGVSAGSNMFVGTFSGGPLPTIDTCPLAGYAGGLGLAAYVQTDGTLTLRVLGTGTFGGASTTVPANFSFLTE